MNVVWYYAKDGSRTGPLSWAELRDAARAGAFGPGDLVWTPGYGAEWRPASTLDALFPPPPEAAPPDPEPDAPPAAPPPLPPGLRSPFAPEAPDGRAPERPRVLLSFAIAMANLRILLFSPFSLGRWCAIALAVLIADVGAQSEFRIVGATDPAIVERLRPVGLDRVFSSPLFTFPERWMRAYLAGAPEAVADPFAVWRDLGASLRDTSREAAAWFASAPATLRAAVLVPLLSALVLFAVLHAWLLARGWSLLLGRVYRRDEPFGLAWAGARAISRPLFRGLVALRLGALAVEAAATVVVLRRFAALDPAAPVPPLLTLGTVLSGLTLLLADMVATGFLRDFALPRVALRRMSMRDALRDALRETGPWYSLYLLVLSGLALAAIAAASTVVWLLAPLLSAVPPLLLFAYAMALVPFSLARCLWSLDLYFRLHPEARLLIPPCPVLRVVVRRAPRPPCAP